MARSTIVTTRLSKKSKETINLPSVLALTELVESIVLLQLPQLTLPSLLVLLVVSLPLLLLPLSSLLPSVVEELLLPLLPCPLDQELELCSIQSTKMQEPLLLILSGLHKCAPV
jgi:hypothetical protein